MCSSLQSWSDARNTFRIRISILTFGNNMQGGTSPSSRTISSTDNPPVLSLSDIMHPMSPSPAPLEEQHTTPEPVLDKSQAAGLREWSLEPSTESEYSDIQNRLHEMGLITTYGANDEQLSLGRVNIDSNLSSRERELTDMVSLCF